MRVFFLNMYNNNARVILCQVYTLLLLLLYAVNVGTYLYARTHACTHTCMHAHMHMCACTHTPHYRPSSKENSTHAMPGSLQGGTGGSGGGERGKKGCVMTLPLRPCYGLAWPFSTMASLMALSSQTLAS